MKITAEPRSDQWNADDFVGGPRTFTIAGVRKGTAEQKYDVELVEGEGRVWRPPPTVLRILMEAWTDETNVWKGRQVTLYRDASVRFGPDAVGGIRVSHMSDLPGGKRFEAKVTERRGSRKPVVVEPLRVPTPRPAREPDRISALMASLGITAREHALRYVADVVGREVASRDELTESETAVVLEALERDAAGGAA